MVPKAPRRRVFTTSKALFGRMACGAMPRRARSIIKGRLQSWSTQGRPRARLIFGCIRSLAVGRVMGLFMFARARSGFSGSDAEWQHEFQELCEDRGWKDSTSFISAVCLDRPDRAQSLRRPPCKTVPLPQDAMGNRGNEGSTSPQLSAVASPERRFGRRKLAAGTSWAKGIMCRCVRSAVQEEKEITASQFGKLLCRMLFQFSCPWTRDL